MFIGREAELKSLENLYGKEGFQMLVLYGRRRIGKTALLSHFCKGKRTLFFTAEQKNDTDNLRSFSRAIWSFFGERDDNPTFDSWANALGYLADHCPRDERTVFVFDEFPYAAAANPSLPSTLQIAIDHTFKRSNLMLALCGSNEGFMESEVLGYTSPLYGRRTSQIRLKPFDYQDTARLLGGYSPEEHAAYYAVFGGTPYYLEQIDRSLPFAENVQRLMFDISGILYAEPQMLIRQGLREPATYTSVLDAIGSGATHPKQIAERAGIDPAAVSNYLSALVRLGLVTREVPFGEDPSRSRKGLYYLSDPFFSYWYRFVSPYIGAIEAGLGEAAAKIATQGDGFSTYVGTQFEDICRQWLTNQARAGNLPFLPLEIGRWWGTDPSIRERIDIDVVAGNKTSGHLCVGECKYRSRFNESEAIQTLEHRATLIPGFKQTHHVLFMKGEPSSETSRKAGDRLDLSIVTLADIYLDVTEQ